MVERTVNLGNPGGGSKLPKSGVPVSTQTGIPQQFPSAIEERRSEIARIESNQAKNYTYHAYFHQRGVGEVQKVVYFPIRYIELPLVSFGLSLAEETDYVTGAIPTVSGCVLKWSVEVPNDGEDLMRQYYIGARIGIVTTGPVNSNLWVHMHFQGTGLVNPTGDLPDLDEEL